MKINRYKTVHDAMFALLHPAHKYDMVFASDHSLHRNVAYDPPHLVTKDGERHLTMPLRVSLPNSNEWLFPSFGLWYRLKDGNYYRVRVCSVSSGLVRRMVVEYNHSYKCLIDAYDVMDVVFRHDPDVCLLSIELVDKPVVL